MVAMIETDVLVVGSGPAGATSAALLGMYGVRHILITKYGWLADTPRAHISNQRAMEVLRDLGLEEAAVAQAAPQDLMANNVFCESIAFTLEETRRIFATAPFQGVKAQRELAERMRTQPKAGVPLLESGEVKRWFELNGWTYPVAGPEVRGAVRRGPRRSPPPCLSWTTYAFLHLFASPDNSRSEFSN